MKKQNNKIGILIGTGLGLSGIVTAVLLKKKTKKLSNLEEDDFEFDEIEDDFCIKEKFDTENFKYDIEKENIDFLVDEYLKYESKIEEEKKEEFRDLSVKAMVFLLKEVISMNENLTVLKKDIDRICDIKQLVQELENCKEEIIALWEHIEALSNIKEVDRG